MKNKYYIGNNISIIERVNGFYVVEELYYDDDYEVLGIFKTLTEARKYAQECLQALFFFIKSMLNSWAGPLI